MIKSIRLLNFQSHADTTLKFSEGVNIIIGASDSGKTAIIRALRWMVTNRPSGDSFRSTWGGKTSVEMLTDDAHVVRSKDKEGEYIVGDLHFKAFGTDVPQEVTDALRFNDINLQQQLDAPFLLSLTPGDVASHFNKIAKFESIDKGNTNVNSAIREITAEIKFKTQQETQLIEDVKKYEHLDMFETDVEVLEHLEKSKAALGNSFGKLQTLASSYKSTKAQMEEYSHALSLDGVVSEVLSLFEKKRKVVTNHDKLYKLTAEWYFNKSHMEHIEETLSLEKPVNELLKLMTDRKMLVEGKRKLSDVLSSLVGIQDRISKGNAFISLKNEEWEKEMPVGGSCPLCNQTIK